MPIVCLYAHHFIAVLGVVATKSQTINILLTILPKKNGTQLKLPTTNKKKTERIIIHLQQIILKATTFGSSIQYLDRKNLFTFLMFGVSMSYIVTGVKRYTALRTEGAYYKKRTQIYK